MKLNRLIERCNVISVRGNQDREVKSVTSDSREVSKDSLFVAVEGICTDGHSYIGKAIEQGATFVVYDKPMIEEFFSRVTYIRVEDSAEALALIASEWYGNPSEQLKLIGVTGTNGKTTIVTLLYELVREMGYPAGLLSTVANFVDGKKYATTHTTLDAIPLNRLLREMVDAGCEYAFVEVSSHAIQQKRVHGLHFSGGIYTNLTQDHLDYHKNMLEYRNVKKSFFDSLPPSAFAIYNRDDRNGTVMVQNTAATKYSYAIRDIADFRGRIFEKHFDGTDIEIDGTQLSVRFVGAFNVYNILAVYGTAVTLGLEKQEVLRVLSTLMPVAGRMQTLHSPNRFTAIVDYAHTPDALSNVLESIREVLRDRGKIITVVGCGGNRDRTKRPIMAHVSVLLSDKALFTSDNPRNEEPQDILNDMLEGLTEEERGSVITIVSRREAIKTACALAQPGDVVLVAGKGHETYQEIRGVKHHFDDSEELNKVFELIK